MKKTLFILFMLFAATSSYAAEHLRERVYLSTDKGVYVAGDKIWCSAWCVDVNTGRLSTFSDIAYVEFLSSEGTVQTGKIALDKGRGAGTFMLSPSLATGNYQVIAYTAQSCNEEGYDYFASAKTISVFNTLSNSRVKDGVEVVDESAYTAPEAFRETGMVVVHAPVSAQKFSSSSISLTNTSAETLNLSLSIYHNDVIAPAASLGINDLVKSISSLPPATFTATRIPEYEGEIIHAHLVGVQADRAEKIVGENVFICVPASKPNIYFSKINENLRASFFTDNLYGNKDLFIGTNLESAGSDCHLETESPFVNPSPPQIAPLYMRRDFEDALSLRSAAMQIGSYFDADTLYDLLPIHQRLLMESPRTYLLDDYTRFPVMEEVFIEFVSEVRVSKEKEKTSLLVTMTDAFRGTYNANMPALLMIDGVPVFDTEKVLAYDPLLVKQIDVYQKTYHVGDNIFGGALNLITYKGDATSFQFGDNVRVVNFQGASYPLSLTCGNVSADYPDYRQTIYWHPMLRLEPGESIEIQCKTPAYAGEFSVTVEGLSESLAPVYETTSFTIEN